jgi:hypothetical protein
VKEIEIGVRTDDVIVVGWIDPDEVPLDDTGVTAAVLDYLPEDNQGGMYNCAIFLADLSANSVEPRGVPLTSTDRNYILHWMFKHAGNDEPINGGNFTDGSGNYDPQLVQTFLSDVTSYKLFGRFQIRYVIQDGMMVNIIAQPNGVYALTGSTHDPCTTLPVGSQDGPANGSVGLNEAQSRMSLICEGSPIAPAIRAMNTLMGKDVPVGEEQRFWNNIGLRISFDTGGDSAGTVDVAPYPTYYIYRNGILDTGDIRAQAASPKDHFTSNDPPAPYPFGTVPCPGTYGTTPGGRCGDAESAPELDAGTPAWSIH